MLRKSRKKVQYEFFEEDASWERQGAVSASSVPRGGASDSVMRRCGGGCALGQEEGHGDDVISRRHDEGAGGRLRRY